MQKHHRHLSLRHRYLLIPLTQSTLAAVSRTTITHTSPVDKMAGQPPPNPLWLYQLEALSWLFLVEFDLSWASRSRNSDSASVWSIETTSGSIASNSDVESNGTTQSVDGSNTSSSDNESHWSNQSVAGSTTSSPNVGSTESRLTNPLPHGFSSPLNPNIHVLVGGLRRSRQASMRESANQERHQRYG